MSTITALNWIASLSGKVYLAVLGLLGSVATLLAVNFRRNAGQIRVSGAARRNSSNTLAMSLWSVTNERASDFLVVAPQAAHH